jgi:hypothetical protein
VVVARSPKPAATRTGTRTRTAGIYRVGDRLRRDMKLRILGFTVVEKLRAKQASRLTQSGLQRLMKSYFLCKPIEDNFFNFNLF